MLGEKKHKFQPDHLPPEFSELKVEWDLSFYLLFLSSKSMILTAQRSLTRWVQHRGRCRGVKVSPMTCFDPIYSILSKSSFILAFLAITVNIRCFSLWFKMGWFEFIQLQIKTSSNELFSCPALGKARISSFGITLCMVLPPNSFSMWLTDEQSKMKICSSYSLYNAPEISFNFGGVDLN